jgi:hypothetical protein
MKNLARCFVILVALSSNTYAQNWIPYQEPIQPAVPTQVVYLQPPQPQPVIVYQWVPYIAQQNMIVEQQRLFCRTQTIVTRPITQWVLQPVVIYR